MENLFAECLKKKELGGKELKLLGRQKKGRGPLSGGGGGRCCRKNVVVVGGFFGVWGGLYGGWCGVVWQRKKCHNYPESQTCDLPKGTRAMWVKGEVASSEMNSEWEKASVRGFISSGRGINYQKSIRLRLLLRAGGGSISLTILYGR